MLKHILHRIIVHLTIIHKTIKKRSLGNVLILTNTYMILTGLGWAGWSGSTGWRIHFWKVWTLSQKLSCIKEID